MPRRADRGRPPGARGRVIPLEEIRAAAERARPFVRRTPLHPLDDRTWLKLEVLQPTGSFKVRGFLAAALALPAERRARGLLTVSAGNAALACAYAARGSRACGRSAPRPSSRPGRTSSTGWPPGAGRPSRRRSSTPSPTPPSRPATAAPAWRSSRTCPVWNGCWSRSAGAGSSPAWRAR
ncbi:MAG: pyridoxal-phosphate dependent enzyme [Chloroflexi bacterium]|nr:MAG: pyridoxal-phosphate dependent enzyme [Chloroflexota bacterium]